jgi:hypothetical protein
MENFSSKPYAGKTPLSESAQRLGSDIKSEAGGLADRAGEAAKTFGDHASEAFDDLKSFTDRKYFQAEKDVHNPE